MAAAVPVRRALPSLAAVPVLRALVSMAGATGTGVRGTSSSGYGVSATSASADAIHGVSTSGNGVYGKSTTGAAGYFDGSVTITGNLQLPATSSASNGVVKLGGVPFLHGYETGGYFGNTFLGGNAGAGDFSKPSSFLNTGIGSYALGAALLPSENRGYANTACGAYALSSNTAGNINTACGQAALSANTGGSGIPGSALERLETTLAAPRTPALGSMRSILTGLAAGTLLWAQLRSARSAGLLLM